MRVRGIVGVTIGTSRFGPMAGLLGDVLGLEALVAASGHAIYQAEDGDLVELRASDADDSGAGGIAIELEVTDLEEARRELEAAGLAIVDADGDATWLAFRTPDGTLLALRQELELEDVLDLDDELDPLDEE